MGVNGSGTRFQPLHSTAIHSIPQTLGSTTGGATATLQNDLQQKHCCEPVGWGVGGAFHPTFHLHSRNSHHRARGKKSESWSVDIYNNNNNNKKIVLFLPRTASQYRWDPVVLRAAINTRRWYLFPKRAARKSLYIAQTDSKYTQTYISAFISLLFRSRPGCSFGSCSYHSCPGSD